MATGIISTGTFLLGPSWLSKGLLAAASAGLVVLSTALAIRLAISRSSVAADIQAPERVFGFFTIVAGIDVLGVRLGPRVIRWPRRSWPAWLLPCGSR